MSQSMRLTAILRVVYLSILLLLALFIVPALSKAHLFHGHSLDHQLLVAPTGVVEASGDSAPTYGPYVGAVTDTSAVIWLRTNTSSEVWATYSISSDLSFSTNSLTQTLSLDSDNTASIHLDNLTPNTTYYYAINGVGTIREFTTFPTPDQVVDFEFVVFADASSSHNTEAVVYEKAVTQEDPAFALQIGDFTHSDPATVDPVALENWRLNNRNSIRDTTGGGQFMDYIGGNLTNISIPFVHIWDDHDYGRNQGNRHMSATYKEWAKQAFLEYFPTYDLPNPDNGLWHSFRYAQAEFFMLDLRYQRDRSIEPNGPTKSILDGGELGAEGQEEWLKNGLLNSTAEWKFIVSSSVFNPLGKPMDSWANFPDEQLELVNFVYTNTITNVVVLSADLHSAGGIDNGTNSYFPELSVPHTNMGAKKCASGGNGCGTWSEGVIEPSPILRGGGYALIRVNADGTVELYAMSDEGFVRLSYTVTAVP